MLFVITIPGLDHVDLFSFIVQFVISKVDPLISIKPPPVEEHSENVQLKNLFFVLQKFIYKTIPGLEELMFLNTEFDTLIVLSRIFIAGPLTISDIIQKLQLKTDP